MEFQERIYVDYLATRNALGNKVGSFEVRELRGEERVKVVLDELNSGNPPHQAYVCAFIHMAPGYIRNNPGVRERVERVLLNEDEGFKLCLALLKDCALQQPSEEKDSRNDSVSGMSLGERIRKAFGRRAPPGA